MREVSIRLRSQPRCRQNADQLARLGLTFNHLPLRCSLTQRSASVAKPKKHAYSDDSCISHAHWRLFSLRAIREVVVAAPGHISLDANTANGAHSRRLHRRHPPLPCRPMACLLASCSAAGTPTCDAANACSDTTCGREKQLRRTRLQERDRRAMIAYLITAVAECEGEMHTVT